MPGSTVRLGGGFSIPAREELNTERALETLTFDLEAIDVGRLPEGSYEAALDVDLRFDGNRRATARLCGTFSGLPVPSCGEFGVVVQEVSGNAYYPQLSDYNLWGYTDVTALLYRPVGDLGSVTSGSGGTPYPIVIFNHGNGYGYDEYDMLCRCIASNGFIVWSYDDYDSTTPQPRAKHAILNLFFAVDFLKESPFNIDYANFPPGAARLVFGGHSQGGEGVALAAKYVRTLQSNGVLPQGFEVNAPFGSPVAAVFALAPPDNSQGAQHTSALADMSAYLMMKGNLDEDVGVGESVDEFESIPVSIATGPTYRGLLMLDGATHRGFSDAPLAPLVPEDGELAGPSQAALRNHYVLSFLRWRVLLEEAYKPWFFGAPPPNLPLPPEEAAKVRVRPLYITGTEFPATRIHDISSDLTETLKPIDNSILDPGLDDPPYSTIGANVVYGTDASHLAPFLFAHGNVIGPLMRLKWSDAFFGVIITLQVRDPFGLPVAIAGAGPLNQVLRIDTTQLPPNLDGNVEVAPDPGMSILITTATVFVENLAGGSRRDPRAA